MFWLFRLVVVVVSVIVVVVVVDVVVKTQHNSTQLKTTLKQLALELDIVVTCSTTPPHHHNFPSTSKPARELKFGIDTH